MVLGGVGVDIVVRDWDECSNIELWGIVVVLDYRIVIDIGGF